MRARKGRTPVTDGCGLTPQVGPRSVALSVRVLRLAIVFATLAAVAGCGGAAKHTQPATLKNRLLAQSDFASFTCQGPPAIALLPRALRQARRPPPLPRGAPCRLSLKRTFAWANPVDFTFQGVPLPETYSPSKAVDFIKKAGFEAGAGQQYASTDRSVNVVVEAIKFKSKQGARDVLGWLHARNLELPCYGSCTEIPSNLAVSGIPDVKAAKQLPQPSLPPGGEQGFTAYAVEFPIGNFLSVVPAAGAPGAFTAKPIVDRAQALYKRVSRLSS